MVLLNNLQPAEPMTCLSCAGAMGSNICTLIMSLADEARLRLLDPRIYEEIVVAYHRVLDTALVSFAVLAAAFWLVLPEPDWLVGYSMLGLCLSCWALWLAQRELRTRVTVESSAAALKQENERLRELTATMGSDLEMLKTTIGAIGDKGESWLAQLRVLYEGQKRENDRHSMLLKGHARIVLLQLIQHFDIDHSMRLNTGELRAAEAFLTAGFPDIDISALESKASCGGVSIADLEPLLLLHLEGKSPVAQPRAQARLLEA